MNDSGDNYFLEHPPHTDDAADYRKLDPFDLLTTFRDSELAYYLLTNNELTTFENAGANTAENEATTKLQNEKLEIGKDGARYLSSVLKEVSYLQTDDNHLTEEKWTALLPTSPLKTDLKTELLSLTAEQESTLKDICIKENPSVVLNELIPELIQREKVCVDGGLEFPEHFWELPDMIEQDFKSEKLEASRETERFLKSALGYFDEKEHKNEISKFFAESSFDNGYRRRRHMSPLYIEPETHCARDSPSVERQDCVDLSSWNRSTESAPTVRDDTYKSQGFNESKYFNSQKTSKSEERVKKIAAYAHEQRSTESKEETKPAIKVEIVGTLLEKTSQTNETTIKDDSSSQSDLTRPISTRSHRPRDQASRNRVTSNVIPSSLGTLLSFMQTRGQSSKRRKLDNASPYFSSSPQPNPAIVQENEQKITNAQEITSKPPCSQQNFPSVYHQYPPKEPEIPLLLILSTTLLQSNRSLITSLENMPPQNLRLIFRDYASPHPINSTASDTSSIIEEADIVSSPTAGIILTTSQETTQTYLPGHGSPGFENRLKERIALVAQRYEVLYVLIQAPVSLDAIIMSSIRGLDAFCISLCQVCTIRTLLISSNHILEWVLAIATKCTISDAASCQNQAQEGEALWSSYLDDQTQWEVFLRHAGLNPFAAQSVLSVLSSSSTQSRNGDDGDGIPDLSKFIEMSPTTRRKIFQGVMGERVLQRVETAVETDWQVEWAVDLS